MRDHPDEPRLRTGETALADMLERIAGHAADALRHHDRPAASVHLAHLAATAAAGHAAMVQALRDQTAPSPPA